MGEVTQSHFQSHVIGPTAAVLHFRGMGVRAETRQLSRERAPSLAKRNDTGLF